MEMTPELLRDACKKNGGYAQPAMNDQLFLQCKGFSRIANLEPYVNLKVLWLEQNGIATIEGLTTCTKLVSLFLQNNALSRIAGLQTLSNLRILNLSHNYITSVEGLGSSCPLLETLQISHNQIASLSACEELWMLADTLSSVDLSFNKIERQEGDDASAASTAPGGQDLTVVNFFKKLPNVSVIYVHGNGLTHGMKNYRKNMIVHLPQLTYLDERPVFPDERRATEAWGRGGEKAESDERAKIKQEKREELSSCVEVMTRAMEANKDTRDRLTKQWEERRDVEREELRQRRLEFKKQVQALDASEYDARGGVEVEEDDAWVDLQDKLEDAFRAAEKDLKAFQAAFQQQREVDKLRDDIDRELREQEELIAQVLERAQTDGAKPNVKVDTTEPQNAAPCSSTGRTRDIAHVDPTASSMSKAAPQADVLPATATPSVLDAKAQATMQYWIKQLDQNDDDVLAQMELDLQGFLKELEPGLPVVRAAAATENFAAPPEESRSTTSSTAEQHRRKMTTRRAVTEAVAVTAATLRDGKPHSTSREAMWETYYTWETRNKKK